MLSFVYGKSLILCYEIFIKIRIESWDESLHLLPLIVLFRVAKHIAYPRKFGLQLRIIGIRTEPVQSAYRLFNEHVGLVLLHALEFGNLVFGSHFLFATPDIVLPSLESHEDACSDKRQGGKSDSKGHRALLLMSHFLLSL